MKDTKEKKANSHDNGDVVEEYDNWIPAEKHAEKESQGEGKFNSGSKKWKSNKNTSAYIFVFSFAIHTFII